MGELYAKGTSWNERTSSETNIMKVKQHLLWVKFKALGIGLQILNVFCVNGKFILVENNNFLKISKFNP